MNLPLKVTEKLNWLLVTLHFMRRHCIILLVLGLVAAFGRTIQLGAFGKISPAVKILLEIVIELSRFLMIVFVLGIANFRKGITKIRNFFTNSHHRKQHWSTAFRKIKLQWPQLLLNLLAFSVLVLTINYLIDLLAYQTCLYLTLKTKGIIATTSSEWTIILFFKNISVIPFTLIFYGVFLLWVTNTIRNLLPDSRPDI